MSGAGIVPFRVRGTRSARSRPGSPAALQRLHPPACAVSTQRAPAPFTLWAAVPAHPGPGPDGRPGYTTCRVFPTTK